MSHQNIREFLAQSARESFACIAVSQLGEVTIGFGNEVRILRGPKNSATALQALSKILEQSSEIKAQVKQ